MSMQIFSTKLSNIQDTWNLDVEPSDTILGLKSKIIACESPSLFTNTSKVRVFISFGTELAEDNTLSYYGIQKNANIFALYSSNVTVCGVASFNGKEVNGLYELRGWDPGGFYYYTRVVGDETFYISFDSNPETNDRWLIYPVSDYTNILAFSSHTVRAAHAFTPYPEVAFDNDNGVWQGGVTVSEGDVVCSSGSNCNPLFDKFAYLSEDGCQRFKRLRHLGYL